MGARRVLASIVQAEGARVVVRVYKQEGDEVERVDWRSGAFGSDEVEELLCLSISDSVPRRRPDRPVRGRGVRRARRRLGGEQGASKRNRST